jgi:hypothetical protein
MLKHVGLHNAKPITIILHRLPNPEEAHMCLLVYDEKLPTPYIQKLREVLQSEKGQASKNLADALEEVTLPDGKNLARLLFADGFLKKVPSNQVFATPYGYQSSNKVKLNELNDMVDSIEKGGDSYEKLKEFDAARGMNRNRKKGPKGKLAKILAAKEDNTREVANAFSQDVLVAKVPVVQESQSFDPETKKSIWGELKSNSEALRNAAVHLLQQAKVLNEKADQLVPPAEKRGRGRPKGSTKVTLTATKQ